MNLYAIAAGTYASTKVDTTTVEPLSSVRCTGHISAISSSRFRSAGLRSPVTAILRSTRSRRAALPSPQSSQSFVDLRVREMDLDGLQIEVLALRVHAYVRSPSSERRHDPA